MLLKTLLVLFMDVSWCCGNCPTTTAPPPPPPQPPQAGSLGTEADVDYTGGLDVLNYGSRDGMRDSMRNHGWHYNYEKNDGSLGDFTGHAWTDVFLVQAHGDDGYLQFIDGSHFDVNQAGSIRNERWLYVFGCLFVNQGPSWANIFTGSTLHGIYGYNQEITAYADQAYTQWYNWMHEVGDQSTLGQTSSPSAFDAYVKASQDNQNLDWAVIDRTTTHNDKLSTAPNTNVYPNDSDGNLQYWSGNGTYSVNGPTPLAVIRRTQAISAGTLTQRYYLRPESLSDSQFVARFPSTSPYIRYNGTVTTIDSPLGFAEHHNVTGGVSAFHEPSSRTVTFDSTAAYNAAVAWINDNGGLPADAVAQPVVLQTQLGIVPGTATRTVGYTFVWRHAAPFDGNDAITVSVDDELVRVPNDTNCEPSRTIHCIYWKFVHQPGVYYYYRLWRTPVATTIPPRTILRRAQSVRRSGALPAQQRFEFTLTPAQVLTQMKSSRMYQAAARIGQATPLTVTSQGFAYWTPPFNDDNPADLYAVPSQYFDVNGRVRVYFDLSGSPLGQVAI